MDPVEVDIGPGLTGIVGPNGCGKSNLVEALRWVMGETSPRRLRGAEMDDVIFAGTATRPARHTAEVQLLLDNHDRTASPPYHEADEVGVQRRIERGGGSDYRVNGTLARQRDVQILFADQATGAQATSVVGQGQIDALIRAKPEDRRLILEEAAGVAGLHARRREAEVKLHAAEQNLTRVDDVLGALQTQRRSLGGQVKQAKRYRDLTDRVRRTETLLLARKWEEVNTARDDARTAWTDLQHQSAERLAEATRAQTEVSRLSAALPALRETEAATAVRVQRILMTRESLEADARRAQEEIRALNTLGAQMEGDRAREATRERDATDALARLEESAKALAEDESRLEGAWPEAESQAQGLADEARRTEAALAERVQATAQAEARQNARGRELADLRERRALLAARRGHHDTQRAELAQRMAARADVGATDGDVERDERAVQESHAAVEHAEAERRRDEAAREELRAEVRAVESRWARINADVQALAALLAATGVGGGTKGRPVLDDLTAPPGLEGAVAAALGEGATASLDPSAPLYWRRLPPLTSAPTLPEGVTALAAHVTAPEVLARRLSQVGLVEDSAQGTARAEALLPGQMLVSREGGAWRWDGLTVAPSAPTAAAVRLQQRNRLAELGVSRAEAHTALEVAQNALRVAESTVEAAAAREHAARQAWTRAREVLDATRTRQAQRDRESAAADSQRAALDENRRHVESDLARLRDRALALEEETTSGPDLEALRLASAAMRTEAEALRVRLAEAQARVVQMRHERASFQARRTSLGHEESAWRDRLAKAQAQRADLESRSHELAARLEVARAKPTALATELERVQAAGREAEDARHQAARALEDVEQAKAEAERAQRRAEEALRTARDAEVRAESVLAGTEERRMDLIRAIREKRDLSPEEIVAHATALESAAESEGQDPTPSVFDLEQTLGHALRERDALGPVNLRAEQEAATLEGDVTRLQCEKDDLVAAIAKLRQGVAYLGREARTRLRDSFERVNEHFQVLFKRLFGGGRAHLELLESTDNEDPLGAGLEIFASPPGKKLQRLSLLSGGERTLTALALLFAVFQTRPSPLCVLDEAEAALDETNIERFCTLVEGIARETGTRFLVITHHRLTMTRMDRLYGVTMAEKGVSQLVSVDLADAMALREDPLALPELSSDSARGEPESVRAA